MMITRPHRGSTASDNSTGTVREQELGSMYDYLAKIILIGPSGTGKSCLLHRFVKNEWRVLSSQTIGVEFATKIIKVGTGTRPKRIKLQLWDTAGTERFRSVSRSYYRGAAGAILIYDLTSHPSFFNLAPFLNDARALASPKLSLVLVGNKADLANDEAVSVAAAAAAAPGPSSYASTTGTVTGESSVASSWRDTGSLRERERDRDRDVTRVQPEGREVSASEATRWAAQVGVPAVMEASAFTGASVAEVFARLASMIVTKIEIGEIDPDDPLSGIQYGDRYGEAEDGGRMAGGNGSVRMRGGNCC